MDAALESSARFAHQGPVQTLGPLIHNPQALDHLARRGVQEAASTHDLQDGTVIIRAHGVPLEDLRTLSNRRRRNEIRITNGTCPEVARVQSLIRRQAARGGFTIILGQPTHAEVVAHRSFATAGCAIIETPEEARTLFLVSLKGGLVVAQTTFSVAEYEVITSILRERFPDLTLRNTICPDTTLRQEEARKLAQTVDAVVVVGGRTSNNTRHLVEIVREAKKPVQWVECAEELDLETLRGMANIGVLAGASTPTWTVDEVVEALEQAGRRSWLRIAKRILWTLQLPIALGLGLMTMLLHHLMGWSTGWTVPWLPVAFSVSLCAILPYADPLGLGAKGRVQEAFLERNRRWFLGLGWFLELSALVAAAAQGRWVALGTAVLCTLAISYQRFSVPSILRRMPGLKDLAPAFAPALLAVGFPWLQGLRTKPGSALIAFSVMFFCALSLHGLRHLRAFHEDRILGREILPVAIGSRATQWLASTLLLYSAIALGWLAK